MVLEEKDNSTEKAQGSIKQKTVTDIKMTGDLYDDVKKVHDAICYLHGMLDILEKECMERDKDKPATELFIRINGMKTEVTKMVNESERILRRADIEQFGLLSKYVRPYLCY